MNLLENINIKHPLLFFFILVFGICTGWLGYTFGNNTSDFEKKYSWLPTTIIPTSLILIASELEKEIQESNKEVESITTDKVKQEVGNMYSTNIQNIRTELDKLNLEGASETKQKILEIIDSIEISIHDFKLIREADNQIFQWLDVDSNKLILLNAALEAIDVSTYSYLVQSEVFEKDIRECIEWLRYSIKERSAFRVNPDRHAKALVTKEVSESTPYEIAINAIKGRIKTEKSIKTYFDKTSIVKDMAQYLIEQINSITSY